jgi:hypothetical protein
MENQDINLNFKGNIDNELVKKSASKKKWPLRLSGILGVGLSFFAVIFWKDHQITQVKEQYTQKANAVINQNSEEMLRNFCKPLSWTVRAELMRNNNEQIMLFINDLVKSKNIRMVSFIDQKGSIGISTDKNFEGKSASVLFQPNQFTSDSFLVVKKSEKLWEVSTPIMGFDKRLGTIILTYIPVIPN